MMKFKRITTIVYDSFGIGQDETASKFNDIGANTYLHIKENSKNMNIPTLKKLGLDCLLEDSSDCIHTMNSYISKGHEKSNAKESMSGHWEMMGVVTDVPFPTFTETGFPKDLISELEKAWGKKIIGNKAASGTDIIAEFGMEELESKGEKVIVYTSNDPVLQICGNEDIIPLEELYSMSKKAREICDSRPEWKVGRIIARPYVGNSVETFKRTSNRHDYAVPPTGKTYLDELKNSGIKVQGVGKIGDLFSMVGINDNISTSSNMDGIKKTLELIKKPISEKEFIFVNLVEFDSSWGHRRDLKGYSNGLTEVDPYLNKILEASTEDDLIIVTADHGNDPSYRGTDHTRELVPILIYSKAFKSKGMIPDRTSFSDIGATIVDNFGVKTNIKGKSFLKELN
ncbi:MAG: phosphopentomutase [Mycoplasmataceae bacterium]|nr:phosphopentomutase [Mycoplasmataceae bacterium]